MDKGLLQKDVAELIGVSEDCLRFWEDGTTTLPTAKQFPPLIAFIGYYPLDHETDSSAGKLRQLRYCQGLNYEQCGAVFGVDASTIRRWELGASKPKPRIAKLILLSHAQILQSIDHFLTTTHHETEQATH
jgi:DNA-binding transcriptional regulator YiaG